MKTKLTFNLEKIVIEKAKLYAQETGQSLSELVQNYLNQLLKDYQLNQQFKSEEMTSKYIKMSGIIDSDLDPVKDRDKIRDIRIEKHMK